jgi:hypothetical protein
MPLSTPQRLKCLKTSKKRRITMGNNEMIDGQMVTIGRKFTHVTIYQNQFINHNSNNNKKKNKYKREKDVSDCRQELKKKRRVLELAHNNFDIDKAVMVTLTFKPDGDRYNELSYCDKQFKTFIQRMNYNFDNFMYLATFNKQDNGTWHYHMLCNLDFFVSSNLIKNIWGNGGVYITHMTDKVSYDNILKYMLKNMSEALKYLYENKSDVHGDKGSQHGYRFSKNLKSNIKVRSWNTAEREQYSKVIDEIKNSSSSYKIMYETRHVIGTKTYATDNIGETVEIINTDVEYTDEMREKGIEPAENVCTRLTLSRKFPEKFPEPCVAVYKGKERLKK